MVFGIIWTLLLLHIFCTEVGSVSASGRLYSLPSIIEYVSDGEGLSLGLQLLK